MMEDFFYAIVAYIAGIITVLASILFLFKSEDCGQHAVRKIPILDLKLPESICDSISNQETYKKRETCLSLNLILQFFFQEKLHDKEIRIWLTELITQEFTELLKHRALSKIINKMEIQDLHLGQNFPVIKAATPVNIQFVKNSTLLKKIEINAEIEYTGGFQLAIDAVTKLAKKAVVKIKVVQLSGKGCLELCRYPYTHWSFSFYEEPEVEFEVVSTVLGHHIPRFKSIIISQLKNLIYKKHTLPHYKLRGPPLINRKLTQLENYGSVKRDLKLISGSLFVTLVKCTRLQPSLVGSSLYFSLTLSEIPLVCAYETPVGVWITQDILIMRQQNTPFGILLRTADDNSQIIETVSSKSQAYLAGLRKNDIVLAVNDVCLVSGMQAAKLFSSFSSSGSTKNINGLDCQEMRIRIKRLIFTDHKKTSMENKSFCDPVNCNDDSSQIFSLSSSMAAPLLLDDEISIESASLFGDTPENNKQPISIQGDKVTCSFSNICKPKIREDSFSNLSTPEFSPSNSPEVKAKTINLSNVVSDLSPIHSCDEEASISPVTTSPIQISPDWEKIPSQSSMPIPIPQSNKLSSGGLQPEKPSVSTHSSRAGTPTSQTFEFVPQMVPPGMPIVKMDLKSMPKKGLGKNLIVLKHFETAPVEGSCEPILGNDFEFNIDEETKYVNICVWSKNLSVDAKGVSLTKEDSIGEKVSKLRKRETKDSFKDGEKKSFQDLSRVTYFENSTAMTGHPDHILVGFANMDIEDVIGETTLNTLGYVTKLIQLQPANSNCAELGDHPLLQHSGFDPKLCYGDVMLAVTHQPKINQRSNTKNLDKSITITAASEDDSPTDATQSDEEDFENNQLKREERDHDFKRTHFNAATHCNFCKKKIWLKDAYQCSECGIICHKKCMLRCEQATVCDFGGLRYREIKDSSPKIEIKSGEESYKEMPEIITTSARNSPDGKLHGKSASSSSQSPRHHSIGSFLSHISVTSSILKRTGSAHNLAPPHISSDFGLSRSLPPSPQHSPQSSRKVSLLGNPFMAEEFDCIEENHLEATLEQLLIYPHDERLVSLARESASNLYSQLHPSERLKKIKHELEVLQCKVDKEGETRKDLALQEKSATDKMDPIKRTKLALLISECDARTQALALLTMHYFTAKQLAEEDCCGKSAP